MRPSVLFIMVPPVLACLIVGVLARTGVVRRHGADAEMERVYRPGETEGEQATTGTGRTGQTEHNEQTEEGQISVGGTLVPYKIRRLPLSAFPGLPSPLRSALEQRHCAVPQTYEARRPENVVRGHLRGKASDDWAVLCSAQGVTSLMVSSSGAGEVPLELASHRDLDRLSRLGGARGGSGFDWGIDVVSPARVRELSSRPAGGRSTTASRDSPESIDHDGIEDSTIERSSMIRYYKGGEWLTFGQAED